jgi:hypothetical protein
MHMITDLSEIRLVAEELSEFSPRLVSSQPIYSLTSPRKPICTIGWRDRWRLNNSPAQVIAISYWIFASVEEALTAADVGRRWLSAQTVLINGRREPIYQPLKGEKIVPQGQLSLTRFPARSAWQANHNFLFVQRNVVVLVAEFGKQVPPQTTLFIARKILDKIRSD